MEKKTNKAKLEIFKFLRKSAESALNRKGIFACRIAFDNKLATEILSRLSQKVLLFLWKFNKYTAFTRVFLHAEFISAMKTVQNPTVFMKTQK